MIEMNKREVRIAGWYADSIQNKKDELEVFVPHRT